MNRNEINRLAGMYSLERYLFDEVTTRFQSKQTLTAYDFFAIVIWKSNRSKSKVAEVLRRIEITASDLMREVASAETDIGKVETLLEVWGIGVPMASAILTVSYPERFTMLDYHVWQVIETMNMDGMPAGRPCTADTYLQFCQACRQAADDAGVSLRNFDRALWAKSWETDLLKLIDEEGYELS